MGYKKEFYLDSKDTRILSLVSSGKTYQQTALVMNISPETVKKRLLIMRKHFKCKNTRELAQQVK